MNRADLERRRAWLVARAQRQRERLEGSLVPWQAEADRIDRATGFVRRRAGWLGFFMGAALGLGAAVHPRLLVAAVRALAATWPLWLRGRSR